MSTGQSMLVILAIALFTTVMVNLHRYGINSTLDMAKNVDYSNMNSLAQYYKDIAWARDYDESTIGGPYNLDGTYKSFPSIFSTTLGRDSGETLNNITTFDDIDDFNGYSAQVTYAGTTFQVDATVTYCGSDGTISGSKTRFKMVKIVVTKPNSPVIITLQEIFTYLPFST